ncbi:hypothetical protein A2154_01875 [Candidatus Gottesmanbacteria bacterium RBG_16_43_7]|uniref:DNA replication and repair protein RecF n=1 Tax=Candidatus Gottesmanbacteria bacterium RBG_16_43_7 TaxID=1798373 RepID=A0A1F5Z7S0_9BACT|nr:MAG: hypothetical protein A2154_01875 [Candidatus Gottesmanbacteria bacterium RBG_16_43_7]
MILTRLDIQNFRNYQKVSFDFSPAVTLISGENSSGKTNIIEAIYLSSGGKSFRANQDQEMIRWGAQTTRVTAKTAETNLEIIISLKADATGASYTKRYLVNGVARRTIDFVGRLTTVLFWPEDMELVTDSPALRRKYLDRVLVQTDREYRRHLYSYERGLRQRNRLLDLIRDGSAAHNQLLFWNQLLIKSGSYITDTRNLYIDTCNRHRLEGFNYKLSYDKSVISESRLKQYEAEEVAAGATLVGPHRDDFIFQFEPAKSEIFALGRYGSRGEQRLGVLWLKLAELDYMRQYLGDKPVLLLDDIFSELDDTRRALVMAIIRKHQTIITTAEDDVKKLLKNAQIEFSQIRLPLSVVP